MHKLARDTLMKVDDEDYHCTHAMPGMQCGRDVGTHPVNLLPRKQAPLQAEAQ